MWKKFRTEMLEKFLNPVKHEKAWYTEADAKYKRFLESKKLEWEMRKKAGDYVDPWRKVEDPERFGGFRGQYWFAEMLWDLKVTHWSDFKTKPFFSLSQWRQLMEKIKELGFDSKEAFEKWRHIYYAGKIGFDIDVSRLGPIEVKTIPFGEDESVNIKKTPWDNKPSAYLVVLKTCDKKMLEFQLAGWLYGYEVFKLEVEDPRAVGRPPFYFCELKDIREPKKLLNMLLEISRKKPKQKKHSD